MPADRTLGTLSHGGHQQVGGSGMGDSGNSNYTNRRKQRHVTRACDNCREKKRKCDGQMPPCGTCIVHQVDNCAYTVEDHRRNGLAQAITVAELRNRVAALEDVIQTRIPALETTVRQMATILGIPTDFLAPQVASAIPVIIGFNRPPLTPMSSAPPSPYQSSVENLRESNPGPNSFQQALPQLASGSLLAVPEPQHSQHTRHHHRSLTSSSTNSELSLHSSTSSTFSSPNIGPTLIIEQWNEPSLNSPIGDLSQMFSDMMPSELNAQASGVAPSQDTSNASSGGSTVGGSELPVLFSAWDKFPEKSYFSSSGGSGSAY